VENERGYMICQKGRHILRGPTMNGGPSYVIIPSKCPEGAQKLANFHTHPGGNIYPSPADIRAARNNEVPHVCIKAQGHSTRCYRIIRGRAG